MKKPAASQGIFDGMLSVDEALAAILDDAHLLEAEELILSDLSGRRLAADVVTRMTQPPFSASAMDGYAVRFEDVFIGARLNVIGEAPAGAPYEGGLSTGEAVRIFTGGVVPDGADHVVIQEDVERDDDVIVITESQEKPRNIRPAGVDFKEGDLLAENGTCLNPMHGSLFAAANIDKVSVTRRPKVAIFSNGDELAEPGADLKPGAIINSNHYALSALVSYWGGEPVYLGRAPDNEKDIKDFFLRGLEADIIVPVGGASVGDYDFVKPAFAAAGGKTVFEKVAIRPGKPTWCGKIGDARIIGLPGNPASAIVTAAIFVQALVRRLAGTEEGAPQLARAVSLEGLPANGRRETYMRAMAAQQTDGRLGVRPASNQDSSLLSPFAKANVLIRRQINEPAVEKGDLVEVVRLY